MALNSVLIVVCGWPLSGKGSIASNLSKALGIHWIDIDDVRVLNFGVPNPAPRSRKEMNQDQAEMMGSYDLLNTSAAMHLTMKRSLIITATYSRRGYWEQLLRKVKVPVNSVRAIWCKPTKDTKEEIKLRLAKRVFGKNCWSTVNTIKRYYEVKRRFELPPISHLKLDSSPPQTIQSCTKTALAYIIS